VSMMALAELRKSSGAAEPNATKVTANDARNAL